MTQSQLEICHGYFSDNIYQTQVEPFNCMTYKLIYLDNAKYLFVAKSREFAEHYTRKVCKLCSHPPNIPRGLLGR